MQNGVWQETQYSNFAPRGQPQTTVAKGVKLSSSANAQDLTTSSSYDAFGNLLSETDASNTVTETDTYDLAGDPLTRTGPTFSAKVGQSQVNTQTSGRYSYDAWGEEIAKWQTSSGDTTGEKANWTTSSYDACGRVWQESNWLWTTGNQTPTTPQSTIDYAYDGLGREITSEDSTVANPAARTVYDARGNVITAWDEGVSQASTATATVSTYDAENRLISETAPGDGTATTDTYAANGNVLTETTADGDETDYAYDAAGNLTKEIDNATAGQGHTDTTTSTYDLGGRLVSQTDQSGLTKRPRCRPGRQVPAALWNEVQRSQWQWRVGRWRAGRRRLDHALVQRADRPHGRKRQLLVPLHSGRHLYRERRLAMGLDANRAGGSGQLQPHLRSQGGGIRAELRQSSL